MTKHHMMRDDIFAALASGGGGERAMRLLVHAQRGKHLVLLRMVVVAATRACHPRATELARAYDLLAHAQVDRPADVMPLLCHPPIGAWAIQALRDLRTGAVLDHGYLTALAAVAALLTRSTSEIEVPLQDRSIFLPFLGRFRLPVTDSPKTAIVRSYPDGAEILADGVGVPFPADPRLDGTDWQGIRRLTVRARETATSFLLDDLDPYRFPEAQTTGRLDGVAVGQWWRALGAAWALLVTHHPETAEEIAAGITVLVPLRAFPGHAASATSRHSFGAIALSQPAHGRSFAAALAHELQHAKLSALLDLVRLLDDPGRNHWYAPWRNDPRPLGALLQGAYAHLGVASFWRRQRHLDESETALHAHVEFVHWRDETRDVVSTLQASGALTRLGARFVDGMAATLDAWREEPVPAAATQQARAVAHRHRAAWQLRNGRTGDEAKRHRE